MERRTYQSSSPSPSWCKVSGQLAHATQGARTHSKKKSVFRFMAGDTEAPQLQVYLGTQRGMSTGLEATGWTREGQGLGPWGRERLRRGISQHHPPLLLHPSPLPPTWVRKQNKTRLWAVPRARQGPQRKRIKRPGIRPYKDVEASKGKQAKTQRYRDTKRKMRGKEIKGDKRGREEIRSDRGKRTPPAPATHTGTN